jgi:DNA damage-inducible protein 1
VHRRIFISVTSRQRTLDPVYQALEVAPDMTVAGLKAVIEGETTVSPDLQALFHNGRPLLDDNKTLEQCQIQEQDMLEMLVRSSQAVNDGARPGQGTADARRNPISSAQSGAPQVDPETIRQQALRDPRVLAQLRSSQPGLADAVSDSTRFLEIFQEMQRRQADAEAKKQQELALLNADPFDVDAQRRIEEIIRQERVMENLQEAIVHTPEGMSY